jgi:hypothetical protein
VSPQNENVRFVQSRNVRFHGMAGGPMETERITLSQRERDRMRVLHEVKQGHLTHREAAGDCDCPTGGDRSQDSPG